MSDHDADGEPAATLDVVTAKAAREQPSFIRGTEAPITDHYSPIEIPQGATFLRTRGGLAKFFRGKKPQTSRHNGWYEIPLGARQVFFPGYRRASGAYGEPHYQFQKV